ncbi:hypothetical protein HMPREF0080_01555 [Anaeroglobus geminatus F0357]|uniref:Uncharacterized protein n=1 Tax=Anaeroglobus geminatus F0357 TaxID=861450 RepID=G9YIR1_9FIRM|nr:hypothetical protein HMPREF0080_01555 [Anaeroglobus geminatus F0357]
MSPFIKKDGKGSGGSAASFTVHSSIRFRTVNDRTAGSFSGAAPAAVKARNLRISASPANG